tara:strand:- start:1872 stop:2195 length:324 start_codon:yes stop_codon:yes gene_type:complete
MVLEIQVKVEEQATHRFKHIVIPLSTKEFEMVERLGDVDDGKPAYELVLKLIGDLQKDVVKEQQLDLSHPEKYFFKINLVRCDKCDERCTCNIDPQYWNGNDSHGEW